MNIERSPWGPSHLFALLAVVSFAFLVSLQKIYNYDIWWHLKVGEYIWGNMSIPTRDMLSFSTPDADWVINYWLSDVLFYAGQSIFGLNGLLVIKSLLIAGAAAGLFLFVSRCGLNPYLNAVLIVFALDISRFRFMLRPQVFQFLGVVFLLWFLYRSEASKYRWVVLFLVLLVWNALHGSAFVAQIFLLFLLIDKLADRWIAPDRFSWKEVSCALGFVAVSLVALFLNPNGIDLYKMVYGRMFFADVLLGSYSVEEHKGLEIAGNIPFVILVFVTGFSFLLQRKNVRVLTFLLFAGVSVLAFGSVRYVAMASFVLVAVIALNGQGWSIPFEIPGIRSKKAVWVGPVILLCLCAGLLLSTFRAGKVYAFGLGINQSRYPFAAIEELKAIGVDGNVYNSWRFGGFVQWFLPGAKTFIDGRCLDEQLHLYNRFTTIALRPFAQYLADNDVVAALIDRKNQRDTGYFNQLPGYRMLRMDDQSVLFVQSKRLKNEQKSGAGYYKYLRLGGYEYAYLAQLARAPESLEVEQELNAAIASSPENFFINFLLAFFYDSKGDPRAAEKYALAASKNPNFAHTHFEIGQRGGMAALRTGDWVLAETIVEEALTYTKSGELFFILGAAQQKLEVFDEAEKAYRASLDYGENEQVMNNLGFVLLELNKTEDAIDLFRQLTAQKNARFREDALYGLVLAYRKVGDRVSADRSLRELASSYPSSRYLGSLQ